MIISYCYIYIIILFFLKESLSYIIILVYDDV